MHSVVRSTPLSTLMILPLMWKIFTCLSDEEDDSLLAGEMKGSIKECLKQRNDNRELQLTAYSLDPRFKDGFISLEDDVKQSLQGQVRNAADDGSGIHVPRRAEASSQAIKKVQD